MADAQSEAPLREIPALAPLDAHNRHASSGPQELPDWNPHAGGIEAFYRDRLGLTVAGESENWGPEQERLNGVFGARLRITALRAQQGPGPGILAGSLLRDPDGHPLRLAEGEK